MGFLKSIGPTELIIILLIVVMVFGVGKLPQVASSIGKSMRAFRDGQKGDEPEEEAEAKPRRKASKVRKTARKPAEAKAIAET